MADSSEILKSSLISMIRHFLSILAAYLVSKGLVAPEILSPDNLLVLAGGIATALISIGWVIWNKLKIRNLVEQAHISPPSVPMEEVKAKAEIQPLFGK